MLAIEDIRNKVARRFDAHAHEDVAGSAMHWPFKVALGRPSKAELSSRIADIAAYKDELFSWAQRCGAVVECDSRRAGGALHDIPMRVVVPDIDVAARIAQSGASARLDKLRRRVGMLGEFPACGSDGVASVLRATSSWSDADYSLLVEAAWWFSLHDATGMTPREVPLPGFSSKWLNSSGRRKLVSLLAGVADLGLVDRPHSIAFAYLDPAYRTRGGRRYDSFVEGDRCVLPYDPDVIIIVENKDTYLRFPEVEGGICVFGEGRASASVLAKAEWVRTVYDLVYWGDIDAAGFEILDFYREEGLSVRSILMDEDAYESYELYGCDVAVSAPRPLPHLTEGERRVYEHLTDSSWSRFRRIEQERIPLHVALENLKRLLANS